MPPKNNNWQPGDTGTWTPPPAPSVAGRTCEGKCYYSVRETPRAFISSRCCLKRNPTTGCICTLRRDHDGPHVHCDGIHHNIGVWWDDALPPPTEPAALLKYL